MKKQEIINEILFYHTELLETYVECRDMFGHLDPATDRAFKELIVIEELLTRLNLEK